MWAYQKAIVLDVIRSVRRDAPKELSLTNEEFVDWALNPPFPLTPASLAKEAAQIITGVLDINKVSAWEPHDPHEVLRILRERGLLDDR
jgi:hypothetical protein